jgi:catechol 2,3-dioxygenase-like lactoylglutathione lyase family enzyme
MTRIASIVLVVRDLEHALAVYADGLGCSRVDEPSEVPGLGARHVFLRAENCLVELIEPHDETSPPGRFLRARGEGVFALELRVEDPAGARAALTDAGVDVREGAGSWYLRPADAHGLLVQVAPAGAADPA